MVCKTGAKPQLRRPVDWFIKTPMTPRQVAENVEGSDGRTRVLAAAIDAADQQVSEYHMHRLVADLGDDQIDDMMDELVRARLAAWTRRPLRLLDERSPGVIRPTAKGRRLVQDAINEEHQAKSVRGRAAAAARFVQRAAGFVTDVKTVVLAVLVLLAVVVALIRGCPTF